MPASSKTNANVFRFDLHVHSWYSPDAADSPEDLIAAARARGLDGMAITDHDTCRAHEYCLRAGLELANGEPVDDFLVVPGVEVTTAEGHLLCIGTTLPDMAGEPAARVIKEITARGGIAIPAHPFDRWRSGIGTPSLDLLEIEAIEVFNSAVSSKSFNDRGREYAEQRGLSMTASSDAHHASAVGFSHTEFEASGLSLPSLIEAIRRGGRPRGQYLSRTEAFKKHFANLFRKRPPDPA